MLSRLVAAATVLIFGLLGACGSSSSSSNRACAPGAQQSCACPNAGIGFQVCSADGLRFGTCDCPGSGSGGATGSGGGSPAGGGGTSSVVAGTWTDGCGYVLNDASCMQCFATECCDVGKTCAANKACDSLVSCLVPCTDATCADDCVSQNSDGLTDYNAVVSCLNGKCAAACSPKAPGADASAGGAGNGAASALNAGCDLTIHDGSCGTCEQAYCCTEIDACFADATCKACWSGTVGTGCAGNAAFAALLKCESDKCPVCVGGGSTTSSSGSGGCTFNSSCGSEKVCRYGECVKPECMYNSDCFGCERCSGNRCVLCIMGPSGCTC